VLNLNASVRKTTGTVCNPHAHTWHFRCVTCYCDKTTDEDRVGDRRQRPQPKNWAKHHGGGGDGSGGVK